MIATRDDHDEPVCIGGLLRFFDDDRDEWIEVPVAVDLAAAIRRLDAAAARRERLHRKRMTTFTDLAARNGDRTDPASRVIDPYRGPTAATAEGWQGPRFSFDLLLGLSRIWPGPRADDVSDLVRERLAEHPRDPWARVKRRPALCDECRGRRLRPDEVCLRCTRSGKDDEIRPPSKMEILRKRGAKPAPAPAPDDGLAGGVGAAQKPRPKPRPKPVKATTPVAVPAPEPEKRKPARTAAAAAWRREYEKMRAKMKGR